MIRKIHWIVCMLLAPAAFAQEKGKNILAWELHYDVQMEPVGKDTAQQDLLAALQMMQDVMAGDSNVPALRCFVSDDQLRVETSGLGAFITVQDKRDSAYYVIDDAFKKAYRHTANMPQIETVMAGDSLVVIDPDDFEIKLLEDTTTLLGWACRKAVFINKTLPDQQVQVWYTSQLPQLYWGKYKYLRQVPGCALAIFTVQGNLHLGIRARQVNRTLVPETLFMPPAGYEVEEVTL